MSAIVGTASRARSSSHNRLPAGENVDAVLNRIAERLRQNRARSEAELSLLAQDVFLEGVRFALRWVERSGPRSIEKDQYLTCYSNMETQ